MTPPIRIGFALTGSFCTFSTVLPIVETLVSRGCEITPIFSEHAATLDTRFGTADMWYDRLCEVTKREPIENIVAAEPIGPKKLFDIMVVAPCTGNTLAKLAHGVTDTTVTMAVKSHLRGEKPVVLAVSTNDALSGSAANLGTLLNRKHYYLVPVSQDAPLKKPTSLQSDFALLPDVLECALRGRQFQPVLLS